jgi:bifunctional ADP-heptose synthase (sugar kinase/adenylyltransferase)
VDALIVMDQMDVAGTGVITPRLLQQLPPPNPGTRDFPIIADSRRGLRGYPPVIFKMNAAELAALAGLPTGLSLELIKSSALMLARQNGRAVFVTLAERGIIGADPAGGVEHVPALPLRGPIDVVGAGDSVTANLAAALAAGATLREAIEFAIIASSIVVHQLGTTGTAGVKQIGELLPALQGG